MRTVVVPVTAGLLRHLAERRVYQSLDGQPRWAEGSHLAVDEGCAIEPYSNFCAGRVLPRAFGAFSYARSEIAPYVRVGRYCSLASDIAWMGADHPASWATTSPFTYDDRNIAFRAFAAARDPDPPPLLDFPADPTETVIGNDVWIGDGAMIGPGVRIGDGAVIGARALVREDVPPYAIVVGQPARIVRLRFDEALVRRFIDTAWWRYAPDLIRRLPVQDPPAFLDALQARLEAGDVRPLAPTPVTLATITHALTAAGG